MLYVSNIPVILSTALIANAMFMGQMLWANYNPQNDNPFFNWIAQFDPGQQQTPTGGLLYYMKFEGTRYSCSRSTPRRN